MAIMLAALPLGINFIEILIHIVNFAILFVALWFLLYKPVRKFVDKRKQESAKEIDDAERLKQEAEAIKEEHEALLVAARQEAITLTEEAELAARTQADEILEEAKARAEDLILRAEEDIALRHSEEKQELATDVSDLAFTLAGEILKREFNETDNDKRIAAILDEWQKGEE